MPATRWPGLTWIALNAFADCRSTFE